MEGPNVESRTWPTDFGKDNDRKDRTGCFVEFFAQNFFAGYIVQKRQFLQQQATGRLAQW